MWWEPASVPLPGDHPRRPIVFRVRIGRLTVGPPALPQAHGGRSLEPVGNKDALDDSSSAACERKWLAVAGRGSGNR